jgi:diguanylate cyclase (GGDEF)-like protein
MSVSIRPPAASRLSNLLAKLADAATRLPPARAWALTLATLGLALVIDDVTGPQVNLVLAYLLIACFASWCLGERVGMGIGIASVLLTGYINGFNSAFPSQGLGLPSATTAWNTLGRMLSMGLLVTLASGLRCALDLARWRASTDGLTGVLNKATFTRQMQAIVSQARRRKEALVIAYIDLDGFKGVNDELGHAAGDGLLCRFAEAAADAIRSDDLFARVGGDEFMALLSVDDCAQGDVAAERLHARLTTILRTEGLGVTCSIGALVIDSRGDAQVDSLIDAADGLMYEVKRSGKNALRIARDDLQQVSRLCPRRPPPGTPAERAA